MIPSIEEQVNYLGKDKFITFSNTNDFPELNEQTKIFLTNIGSYSNDLDFPHYSSDEILKYFDNGLIEFGRNHVNEPICIDPVTGTCTMQLVKSKVHTWSYPDGADLQSVFIIH